MYNYAKRARPLAGPLIKRAGAVATRAGALTAAGYAARRVAPGVARAVGAAARFGSRAVPYVGAAMTAYDMYSAGKSMMKGSKPAAIRRSTKGYTNSRYRGKLVNRRRMRRPRKDPYREYGFVNVDEVTGLVKDPDCVYVGHSAMQMRATIEMIAYCLLRKLFARANVPIRNLRDPIPTYKTGGAQWQIRIERRYKDTGIISNEDYTIPNNTSIYQIVGCDQDALAPLWQPIIDNLYYQCGYITGDDDLNAIEFNKIILYREELNVGSSYQFETQIFMDEVLIRFFAVSDIKIQNRTLSATGSADAENVGNSPLVGRAYEFNGGAPVAKVDNISALEVVWDVGGVITVRANELGDSAFREPPSPSNFGNCVRTGQVRLDPGEVRSNKIKVAYKERLFAFLRRLNPRRSTRKMVNKLRGKSALYALEDVINVNGSSLIEIAYENNRTVGCYLTIDSNRSSVGKFSTTTRSNVPA